jgi:hypothetical protein
MKKCNNTKPVKPQGFSLSDSLRPSDSLSQISRGNFLIAGSQARSGPEFPPRLLWLECSGLHPPVHHSHAQEHRLDKEPGRRPPICHQFYHSTTATSSLKPLACPPSPPLTPPIHGFFPAFSRSHAHSSILRYPCATDPAPVELHCDHEPGPGLHRASTVPRPLLPHCCRHSTGPPPKVLWTDVLGYPRSLVTRTRLLLCPPSFEGRPVLIHNSPFSSSGSTLLV